MLTPDQIAAAQKANLETLFGLMRKTIEGVEKLAELNMSTMKLALSDSARQADAAMSVKDAQQLLALQASMLQPLMEKTTAYTQQLYHLTSESRAEASRAIEERAAEMQRAVQTLMQTTLGNAPAGSEAAVAALRNAMGTANEALESMHKAFSGRRDGRAELQGGGEACSQACREGGPQGPGQDRCAQALRPSARRASAHPAWHALQGMA